MARLSLEHKLPILIGGLLLVVIVALSTAAFVEMRRTTLDAAANRLQSVATQFRDLLGQSGAGLRAQATAAAAKPGLAEFARSRDAALQARALESLRYAGPQPEQVLATELRDRTGAVILSTNAGVGVDTISAADVTVRPSPTDSAVLGRFRMLRDAIVYPAAAPVLGFDSAYVVQWRRLGGTRRGREELGRLVGSDATLFVGNANGGPWSDLEGPIAAPGGTAHVAPIPGTPWAVAVDFPRAKILAPLDRFLWRLAAIALAALVLGLVAAWLASRQITKPLRQLTGAADAIAGGDYAAPPRIDRFDELGRLGDAFAVMAEEIRDARSGLESKVEERTRDLNRTLDQLHDAQDSLVRREKLAMLGQLAGGVGHELRNPLGVMTNAVYYLRMVLTTQPANVHEYLGILQQQITLSEKIVSDLLDFARSRPPQRALASLTEVTTEQIGRLGSTNGVQIDARLSAVAPTVFVDRTQVGQIILNLLTNAIQAIDDTGTITVRAGVDGACAYIDVTDTGPGVTAANLDKIFEPLFTTKARGIGLGLAVSRTLARANGGELSVDSPPGQGATFRLTLPIAAPAES